MSLYGGVDAKILRYLAAPVSEEVSVLLPMSPHT
jgi:hypothetical protein